MGWLGVRHTLAIVVVAIGVLLTALTIAGAITWVTHDDHLSAAERTAIRECSQSRFPSTVKLPPVTFDKHTTTQTMLLYRCGSPTDMGTIPTPWLVVWFIPQLAALAIIVLWIRSRRRRRRSGTVAIADQLG